jgi:predicted alpha/beta hydrolase family esterase
MQRTVLFVQGAGEGTYDEWDCHLVKSLEDALGPDFTVTYPRMPGEVDPDFAVWMATLQREMSKLRDGDILIGHSAGGTCLIQTLAAESVGFSPGAVILLAAPFFGPGGWQADGVPSGEALGSALPPDMAISLWHGDADEIVPHDHAELYARALPRSKLHLVPGRDHQFNNDLRDVAADVRRLTPERQS